MWRSHGEATPRNWSHPHVSNVIVATTWIQQAFRGYRDETRSKSVRAYQIPIRGKSVREDGERGRDKIAEGKGRKKISYKNGEVSLNREYRYLSRSTYGVLDITRACIAIDGSENSFWGVVWLMICFARETLRQSGWWRVIICEMINWTEKISREE